MGYKVAWAATRGKSREAVLEIYGLEAKQPIEDIQLEGLCGVQLGEWYIVFSSVSTHNPDALEYEDIPFATLSTGAETIGLISCETSMNTEAAGWMDGERIWKIWHDGGFTGVHHLDLQGELPPEFFPIRDVHAAKQVGVTDIDHTFSTTEDLVFQLIGFMHDRAIPGAVYEELVRC